MKKHQPSSSKTVEDLRRRFEQQGLGDPNSEPVYATVNKKPKEQRQTQSEAAGYASPRNQPLSENPYASPRNQPLSENPYAPQRPPEGAEESAYATPNRSPQRPLTNPYAIGDLEGREWPEYDRVGGAQGGRDPQEQEPLYADIDFDQQGRPSPQKPLESIYATVGMGARDEHGPLQQENPIYAGVSSRRTTSPPRSQKDVITTKLLQHTEFQYGVRETQERCAVVYGNPHALNEQLSQVLENPQMGEQILRSLAENPEGPGKLAGRTVFGIKTSDRKAAEEEFQYLYSSLEKHIYTAQKLHKAFTRQHEKERSHERGTSQERQEHGHHHHHHRRGQEREQNAPEQSAQRKQSPKTEKGMAFAM
ncbi:BID domain-containing T4SS effector [Bartonella acomydis]|uniref:BepD protein n=1 Tax=Bartonella acomydis TaxID=686234 RepID=A0ABP9MUU1_9HYPH